MEKVNFVDGCRRKNAWAYSTSKGCVDVISGFRDRIEGYTVFRTPACMNTCRELRAPRASRYEMGFIETCCLTPPHHCRQRLEIVALTVKDFEFLANDEQVRIYPDPTFVPKTVDKLQRRAPLVLDAFFPEHQEKNSVTTCPDQSEHCVFITRA